MFAIPNVDQVLDMCRERKEKARKFLGGARDTEVYGLGEIEGWNTCIRVLMNVPDSHTPAQAMYALAGFHADFSTCPKHRSLYDKERGFMDDRESRTWNLAWNRVISRVQGWLEAEYGPAEYENTKDLPRPPLPLIDFTDKVNKKDMEESVKNMLGK